ncbi:MAG: hypothetical protein AAFP69_23940, partial [Planctomycetota bacterium]
MPNPTSTADRWFHRSIESLNTRELLARIPTIQHVSDVLEDAPTLQPPAVLHPEALRDLVPDARLTIKAAITEEVHAYLRGIAAEQVINKIIGERPEEDWLQRYLHHHQSDADGQLLEMAECANAIYLWMRQTSNQKNGIKIDFRDWSRLRKLARDTRHGPLLFLAVVLGNRSWFVYASDKWRQQALEWMQNEEFQDVYKHFGSTIRLVKFVSRSHAATLVETAYFSDNTDHDFAEAVLEIVQQRCSELVSHGNIISRVNCMGQNA